MGTLLVTWWKSVEMRSYASARDSSISSRRLRHNGTVLSAAGGHVVYLQPLCIASRVVWRRVTASWPAIGRELYVQVRSEGGCESQPHDHLRTVSNVIISRVPPLRQLTADSRHVGEECNVADRG